MAKDYFGDAPLRADVTEGRAFFYGIPIRVDSCAFPPEAWQARLRILASPHPWDALPSVGLFLRLRGEGGRQKSVFLAGKS